MRQVSDITSGFGQLETAKGPMIRRGLLCGALGLALVLGACGRKGPLETPSAGLYEPLPQAESATGTQVIVPESEPVPEPEKRGFFLDFLI